MPIWSGMRCTAGWATCPIRSTAWLCSSPWTGGTRCPTSAQALDQHDVLLLDRYISANAAYAAARLGAPDTPNELPAWVRDLEVTRFGLPQPDLQILLATDPGTAAQRARERAEAEAERALDRFEADAALQRRTSAMYAALAEQNYLSPWRVLRPGPDGRGEISPDLLAADRLTQNKAQDADNWPVLAHSTAGWGVFAAAQSASASRSLRIRRST